ncbi:CAP domain-containing protein [Nonomuraea sp. NPDC000554]|uniref:CAP domain-containing protein n=1 Tax=Nonomuraea sp. NPDC000554 TaxID=3154259 RepID=UPI003332698E
MTRGAGPLLCDQHPCHPEPRSCSTANGQRPLQTGPEACERRASARGADGDRLRRGKVHVTDRLVGPSDRHDGINHYDFNHPGYSWDTGWFTQVVWKSSTQLGCARATSQTSGRSSTYVVCLYNPPGNLLGNDGAHFRDNVPRPVR